MKTLAFLLGLYFSNFLSQTAALRREVPPVEQLKTGAVQILAEEVLPLAFATAISSRARSSGCRAGAPDNPPLTGELAAGICD